MPSVTTYRTETSYDVADTVQVSIGDNMLEISRIKKVVTDQYIRLSEQPVFLKDKEPKGPEVREDPFFKVSLVYTGKSDSVVKVAYREYVNDIARPSFYIDLEYDLDESRRISFRSLEMEVIEATNEVITFVIVDDGGLPWLPDTL